MDDVLWPSPFLAHVLHNQHHDDDHGSSEHHDSSHACVKHNEDEYGRLKRHGNDHASRKRRDGSAATTAAQASMPWVSSSDNNNELSGDNTDDI